MGAWGAVMTDAPRISILDTACEWGEHKTCPESIQPLMESLSKEYNMESATKDCISKIKEMVSARETEMDGRKGQTKRPRKTHDGMSGFIEKAVYDKQNAEKKKRIAELAAAEKKRIAEQTAAAE